MEIHSLEFHLLIYTCWSFLISRWIRCVGAEEDAEPCSDPTLHPSLIISHQSHASYRPFDLLIAYIWNKENFLLPRGPKQTSEQTNRPFQLPDVLIISFISQNAIQKTPRDLIRMRAVRQPTEHKNKWNDWTYRLMHEALLITSCAWEYFKNFPQTSECSARQRASTLFRRKKKLMRSCCGSVRSELTSEPTFRGAFGLRAL